MRSHPIIMDFSAIFNLVSKCNYEGKPTTAKDVFDFVASHEIGHFIFDPTGHDQEAEHLMSQQFSCKALSEEGQTLPYTSATVPAPPSQGSEYLTQPSLVEFCKQYPRYCRSVSNITEQKAHIVYPSEDDVLRWLP